MHLRMGKNILWLIIPAVVILCVHLIVGYFLPSVSFTSEDSIHEVLKTFWSVEAALAGGVLVLLFFVMESFSRMNPIEVTLSRFHQAIAVFPIFGGLLAILIGTGLAVTLTLPNRLVEVPVMLGIQWFLVLDSILFLLMIFEIGWLITAVIRYTIPSAVAYFNDVVAKDGTTRVAIYEFQEMLDKATDLSKSSFELEWTRLSDAFYQIHNRTETAIQKQDISDIEAAINFYRTVAISWSNARTLNGISFDLGEKDPDWPRIPKPILSIIRPLDRMFADLNDLIVSNFSNYPSRGYKWLLEWPLNLLSIAVSYNDHLLFQKDLELYEALYTSANTRNSFNVSDDIINSWRESWRGPERLLVYELRQRLNPSSDILNVHTIDYIRQIHDSSYCLIGLAFSTSHNDGAGHLIASHSTVQNLLWRIDATDYGYSNISKARKVLFDNERRLGILLLLGIALGEWRNGRCDVSPLNYLIQKAYSISEYDKGDFLSITDLLENTKMWIDRLEKKDYPPWLWRWIQYCPHELVFPGEGIGGILDGPELLSIGILLVLSQIMLKEGQDVLVKNHYTLVVPLSFEYVTKHMSDNLDKWKDLVCGDSLTTFLQTLKTNKGQKGKKRFLKISTISAEHGS